MKHFFSLMLLSFALNTSYSQVKLYSTKTGTIFFDAGTGVEDIKATNKGVTAVIQPSTGAIQFEAAIKGFEFKIQLMEDHFNENYMDSEKFPKSTFRGTIENPTAINYTKDGNYPVIVTGTLEMHGVKKDITAKGTISVKKGEVSSSATFDIKLADFNIKIPAIAKEKLSEKATIKVDCTYSAQ
ncbi:MAG: YceI family protein [Ferruginibacter sp.]